MLRNRLHQLVTGDSMPTNEKNKNNAQIGLHYYPDSLHFRLEDLKKWLPEFQKLGLGWLVIKSEIDRAIPEFFLRSLLQEKISPIIEFNLPLHQPIDAQKLRILLQVYSRWGVQYIILYDRPNQKESWQASSWIQQDLVERFLDQYIPLARLALEEGLIPVFPPLEPGGSYWDTAFLRSCLSNLVRRKQDLILKNLVLAAYAHSNNKNLNWGSGGPEKWPETRPYFTPNQSQNQLGFRIFDWYQAIAQAVIQKEIPIILLQSGITDFPQKFLVKEDIVQELWQNQADIINVIQTSKPYQNKNGNWIDKIPSYILACNFWLLTDDPDSKNLGLSWYQNDKPVSFCIQQLISQKKSPKPNPNQPIRSKTTMDNLDGNHPINHYLLLPTYEWGVSDWHLEVIQPFVKKHMATVGFSINEASLAKQVTVIGNPQSIPEEILEDLRQAGCKVERISGDGTSIATQLTER